jgi:hypothetical protein
MLATKLGRRAIGAPFRTPLGWALDRIRPDAAHDPGPDWAFAHTNYDSADTLLDAGVLRAAVVTKVVTSGSRLATSTAMPKAGAESCPSDEQHELGVTRES